MAYSWDTDYDYDSGGGKGFSFHDARKSYDDVKITRSKKTGKKTGKKTDADSRIYKKVSSVTYTYRSDFLKTDALYPIIIGIDTTGSMADWPKVFFDKLPLLYQEAVKYFPECEISFQAINDFPEDGPDVALQPAPFGKGSQLDEYIGKLYPAGGGGGQSTESYEIFAAYNSFLEAPKAIIKPVAIILGDEAPFDRVPEEVCQYYGLSEKGDVPSQEAFRRLHARCEVFLVRKPYYGFGKPDEPIIKIWKNLAFIQPERILNIKDPKRVVDVILGILGIITGKADLFEEELIKRQEPSQVKEVMKSLRSLKATYHTGVMTQQSRTSGLTGSKKTKGLKIDA